METIKNDQLAILPDDVKSLAERVSEQKQQEVISTLNKVFAGTADWEKQVEAIAVKSPQDIFSIQLADTARKNAKTARIAAEKIFDQKREDVQQQMIDFKLEDSLWLKAKQIMMLKFKAIEEKAEWKAKTAERYDREQKRLLTERRYKEIAVYQEPFTSDFNDDLIGQMSEEMFQSYLAGLKKSHDDKIETARIAEEKRIKELLEEQERQKKIQAENARLQKELLEKEEKAAAERKKAKEEQDKIRKEMEEKLAKERAISLKLAEEKKNKEALELKIKKNLELAERKAQRAPDKNKLLIMVNEINNIPRPTMKTLEGQLILDRATRMLNEAVRYIETDTNKL